MTWVNFGEEIKRAVNRAGIKKTIDATFIVEVAKDAVIETFEKNLANAVEPIIFRDNTLTLRANSSVAAQEARLQEHTLIGNINKRLGKDEVFYITIRQ
jgi:hypothetical protein